MRKKPLSMRKLYELASDFLIERYKESKLPKEEKEHLVEEQTNYLMSFFNYIWEHKEEK